MDEKAVIFVCICWILTTAYLFVLYQNRYERLRNNFDRTLSERTMLMRAVSHQIREPLNRLFGALRSVHRDQDRLSNAARDQIRSYKISEVELRRVLVDFTEMVDALQGSIEFENSQFDLEVLLKDHVETYNNMCLDIEFKSLLDWEEPVFADKARIDQCLTNILEQVVFQTASTQIRLACRTDYNEKTGMKRVAIDIIDPVTTLDERLIESYFWLEESEKNPHLRGRPAAVISMGLAKKVCQLMGGDVHLRSMGEQGLRFTLSFEALQYDPNGMTAEVKVEEERPRPKKIQNSTKGILEGLTVLLVDDNETNLMVLEGLLEDFGLTKVLHAHGGTEAVKFASEVKCHLIFMDIQMPDLNGIDATKQIRTKGGHNGEVPIVAVTGSSRVVNESLCKQAGMNGFMEKPVDTAELQKILQRLDLPEMGKPAADAATAA